MKKSIFIFFLLGFLCKAGNPPSIIFKENKGQWPEKVLFGTEIYNTKFYVNKNSFNYCVYNPEEYVKLFGGHKKEKAPLVHAHNYVVEFVDGQLTNFTKNEEQPEYYNYFLGQDKSKWASNVRAFGTVFFKDVYNGVDLKLYSSSANLKYDLIIKPNGSANSIKLNFNFTDGIEIFNGELIIKTSVGTIIEKEPFAYQIINGSKKQVKCKYVLLDRTTVGFSFPEGYNKNYELIIDPVVVVCSYSGATAYAYGDACSYDSNGNIYTGAEADLSYPTTPGAFQANGHADTTWWSVDIALSVYSSNGSSRIFATYLGGDYMDYPLDIVVKNNEIAIMGGSGSYNFPCTPTAFDTINNSTNAIYEYDITLSKLNMTGTSLLASTYIGGSKNELINNYTSNNWGWLQGEMEIDKKGNVFIVGATNSIDFPVTSSVISNTLQGVTDAFLLKIDPTLSHLIWSTFLGGTKDEYGASLKLDGTGGVYCYGVTTSTNYPTTSGAYNTVKNGPVPTQDLFITHIDSLGQSIIASTFLGTNSQDNPALMQLDKNNNVYVVGSHTTPSFLIPSPGTYSNPSGYNSIYKLNASLSGLVFKTKFGFPPPPIFPAPSPYLAFCALMVDSCEKIYIAGWGQNFFPTTPNAFQSYGGGNSDLYFAQFNPNCSSLAFASYFGGTNTYTTSGNWWDESTGLSDFDNRGHLYMAFGSRGGAPITPNAYATTWNPILTSTFTPYPYPCNDVFAKIDFQSFINATSSYGSNIIGCPPFTPTFVSTTNTGNTYWNLGNGNTSTSNTVSSTYTNLGNYNILLVVTDTSTCNRYDSIKSNLSIINPTAFDLGDDIPTCINTKAFVQSNVSAVTYSWSSGETTPDIYGNIGTYTLTINNGGCTSSDVVNVIVAEKKLSERFPNVVTANGDNVNDFIDLSKYNFEEIDLTIYDRWGREVERITDTTAKWNPDNLTTGTYFYVANYKSSCIGKFATDKGFISVFK